MASTAPPAGCRVAACSLPGGRPGATRSLRVYARIFGPVEIGDRIGSVTGTTVPSESPELLAMPDSSPMAVFLELAGWTLLLARLELGVGRAPAAPAAPDALAELRRRSAARARARFELPRLPEDATVAAVRALFRAAGCDPTRYRPSSEALLRRVLKGEDLPAIQPLVDLNNCLSIDLAVPCSVAAEGSLAPPVCLRAGQPGAALASL